MTTREFRVGMADHALNLVLMVGLLSFIIYFFVYPVISGYLEVEGGDIRTKILIIGLAAAIPLGLAAGFVTQFRENWSIRIIVTGERIVNGDTELAWEDVVSVVMPESTDKSGGKFGLKVEDRAGKELLVPKNIRDFQELLDIVRQIIPDGVAIKTCSNHTKRTTP